VDVRRVILALVVATACDNPPVPPRPMGDGGPPMPVDAGPPVFDAGSGQDAGPDAGPPPEDGGPPPDAGSCPPPTGTACAFTSPPQNLTCLSGVRVITHDTDALGRDRYVLGFQQPVDHDDPNSPTFEQTVWLMHNSAQKPNELLVTGYDLYDTLDEISERFDVNVIAVEHRYFGTSFPDGGQYDYTHLDIRQAALDLHAIRVAFAGLYPKPWVSTGASKGGMTMVFYRRFFPCDVVGTIAYVAPHSVSERDTRYNPFLDAVGGTAHASCRAALINLQTQLLQRRALVEATFDPDAGYVLSGGLDTAYENAVIDTYWGFWQYTTADDPNSGCPSIPTGTLSDPDLVSWGQGVFSGSTDDGIWPYVPYYYQAATQLGDADPFESHFSGLLAHPGTATARHYVPASITVPAFDPAPMADIQDWLSTDGQSVVFVYGEFDPWSAAQYDLGQSFDTFKGIAPADNHFSQMFNLGPMDQETAMQKVEAWLGEKRMFLRPPHAPARTNEWVGHRRVPAPLRLR
jgi:hypothetical protein